MDVTVVAAFLSLSAERLVETLNVVQRSEPKSRKCVQTSIKDSMGIQRKVESQFLCVGMLEKVFDLLGAILPPMCSR